MVEIFDDYSNEPKDHFLQISEQLNSDFYDLEMESFSEDISFYQNILPKNGAIIELGCGSGRIADQLASPTRPFIGLDLSLARLRAAQKRGNPYCSFINGDMVTAAFTRKAAAIIIPYNTLNLLTTPDNIKRCLDCCRASLSPGGQLIVQLFIPSMTMVTANKKTFQFQTFARPGGGRIIKEVLKKYIYCDESIQIEERYRVRPMQQGQLNEDWNTKYTIAAFSPEKWLALFSDSGFTLIDSYSDYNQTPSSNCNSSCFLASFTFHNN